MLLFRILSILNSKLKIHFKNLLVFEEALNFDIAALAKWRHIKTKNFYIQMDGWLACNFTSFSTIFQSY